MARDPCKVWWKPHARPAVHKAKDALRSCQRSQHTRHFVPRRARRLGFDRVSPCSNRQAQSTPCKFPVLTRPLSTQQLKIGKNCSTKTVSFTSQVQHLSFESEKLTSSLYKLPPTLGDVRTWRNQASSCEEGHLAFYYSRGCVGVHLAAYHHIYILSCISPLSTSEHLLSHIDQFKLCSNICPEAY